VAGFSRAVFAATFGSQLERRASSAFCGSQSLPSICMARAVALVEFLGTAVPVRVRRHLAWKTESDIVATVQCPRTKHFVEFFCGTGGLVAALSQRGLRCGWFDLVADNSHDLCTTVGFALAVQLVLAIAPGGVAWFGVPCSTFVWMARGHTKRTRQSPLGNVAREDVRRANVIVKRVCLLLKILRLREVFYILEQPAGSLLWHQPSIRLAARMRVRVASRKHVRRLRWSRCFVWLGHYGHNLCKPTELCGVFPGLATFLPSKRPVGKSACGVYRVRTSQDGKKRWVCGLPGLKATEHYPRAFCVAVARHVRRCIARMRQ